jgi:AhpD family alkylhydroperoxidase
VRADTEAEKLRERLSDRFKGRIPEFYQVYLQKPHILKKFLAFRDVVMKEGELSPVLKEKIAFLVSVLNDCEACSTAHRRHLVDIGCSALEIDAVEKLEIGKLDKREAIALKAASEAVQNKRISERTLRELRKEFTEDEFIEILSVVSLYMFLNTFNNALGLRA